MLSTEDGDMTVRECYAALEGNYDEVLGRLMAEDRIKRFALKFLADGSYELLKTSLAAKDQETAFRAAHTLKGVCQNLSFTKLYQSSSSATEALRDGDFAQAESLFEQLTSDYNQTISALQALQNDSAS